MLKKFLIGTFALVALTFAVSASAAYDFGTTTLRVGSRGEAVKNVQTVVGATPVDGVFGNITKAKVMAWQAAHGLTADGVVGPATKAAMNAAPGTPVTGLPAGCTSTVGYSSTTGVKCDGGTTTPGTDNNGPLTGGAGDLTLSGTSTDVEDSFKEGDEDVNVIGFKAEADGSDIALTNVKVLFSRIVAGSEDIEDYVDEVKVFKGSTEVGSADASDFSRDSGSPDIYSRTISLNNAVVREGDKDTFYVAVTAASNIDSDDVDDNSLLFSIDSIRYQDATGVILSENDLAGVSDVLNDSADFDETVDVKDVSFDDQIDIKSSTSNPDDSTVTVEENSVSDETLALAFKLDVDEDSSDVMITSLPVTITFDGLDTDNDGDTTDEDTVSDSAAETVIDSVIVKAGGEEYEAELDSGSVSIDVNGDGTATYVVDFEDDEFTIEAGDVEDVKVYITFNDQDGNYNEGVTVQASIEDGSDADAFVDIEAETSEDDIDVEGSERSGAVLTLSLSEATITVTTKDSDQNEAGTIGTFSFEITVEAEGGAVEVDATSVVTTLLGPALGAGTMTETIVNLDGDATVNGASDFTVEEGETNTFSIAVTVDPANPGQYYVRLDSVAGITVNKTAGPENLVAA